MSEPTTEAANELVPLTDTHVVDNKDAVGAKEKVLEGVSSGLTLFSPSMWETGVEKECVVDYQSLSGEGRRKALDFHIGASNDLYFDFSKSTLQLSLKIMRSDGTQVDDTDLVGFINLPGHSIWRSVDVLIQNKLISSGISVNYAYKAILDHLVSHSKEYLESLGQTALFYKDSAHLIDQVSMVEGVGINRGFYNRAQYTSAGHTLTLEYPLAHDIATLNCYLPSGLDVKIRLWPADDDFALHADKTMAEKYHYQVSNVLLKMRGVQPTKAMREKHEHIMLQRDAVLHYTRSVIKSFTIPGSVNQWQVGQLWSGPLPYECIVCLVESDSYLGNAYTSAYNFRHYGLTQMNLYLESYQDITFRPQIDSKNWVTEYRALYEQDSAAKTHSAIIDLSDWSGGYSLFRFRLSTNQTQRKNRKKAGVGRLTLTFGTSLPHPGTLLCYSKFHDRLLLDHNSEVWLTDG